MPDTADEARPVDLPRDIAAVVLVAITLLTLVSVVTRSPADPIGTPIWPISRWYVPDATVFPMSDQISNACGYWGALIASVLLDAVGIAVALLIAAGGGVAVSLLHRGRLNAPVLRSLGGVIVLPAAATAASLASIDFEGAPVVGAGGYLGAMGSTWLLQHFAPAGAWILTLTAAAIGMLLTTDYALLIAGKKIVAGGKMVSVKSYRRARGAMPTIRRRRQPFTDLEQPIRIEGEEPEPTRVIKHPVRPKPDSVDPADESETEDTSTPRIKVPSGRKPVGTEGENEASDEWVDDDSWDDEDDEVGEDTHEIEFEDQTIQLRHDEAHELKAPQIKAPPRREKSSDPKAEFAESVLETAPAGSEDYQLPSLSLLTESDDINYDSQREAAIENSHLLKRVIKSFGFTIDVTHVDIGPVISQYEIELESGLRLNKITALSEDIAIALRVPSVRIVAPIPGKNTVGIEVPNEDRQVVRLRDVIEESGTQAAKMNIPVFLGKDVSGNPMVVDLAKMPHLLIAGRTGTGKSVCLNAIICSVLMCCRPDEVRMLMIDPKMVELSGYGQLPHLMHPVITDMRKAEAILAWAVDKMEERYTLLAKVGVRHINSFNDLGRDEVLRRLEIDEQDEPTDVPDKLPFIVIVADEMADLMMTAGKDVEQHIIRLAQKSRAVGIHLILATQKPTVDVITGLIKSNLPARLSFQVASKTDSRVVLDENGADKLLGNGDMLFLWPGTSVLIRGQGTYLGDDEIDAVCGHCSLGEQNFVGELMNLKVDDGDGGETASLETIKNRDELYDSAIEVVIREGRGSCSLLQRCLGIGYGRAAKLIDFMAEDGIVGEYNGSKAREVTMTMAQWHDLQGIEGQQADIDEYDDAEEAETEAVATGEEDEYEDYE